MKLHTVEWGHGSRIALLLHGITADSTAWEQVGPALVDRGYRAVAVDLRGHGSSPRAASYQPARFADDVLETVAARPALAIGHSLGGWVLALAVDRLQPALAVYEDPAWTVSAQEQRDIAAMLRSQPSPPGFDPHCLSGLLPGHGYDDSPSSARVPSLVMLADHSDRVGPEAAADLRRRGFTTETVPGSGHWIHAEDFSGFMDCLDRWVEDVGSHPATGADARGDAMQTPREVAESYWAAECTRDLQAVLEHYSQDAVVYPPDGEPLRGHDQIKTFYADELEDYPGLEVTIVHEVTNGSEASLEWEAVLIDKAGRRHPFRGVNVVRVEDGRFQSVRAYFDPALIERTQS